MKRSSAAAVAPLFVLVATSAWANCTAYLEPISGVNPFIECRFGIELWEQGKQADKGYQQWHLTCESPPGGQASCRLERIIYTVWQDTWGASVVTHEHSTADDTLRLVDGRWQQGTLDFDVVTPSLAKDLTHVAMRIEVKQPLVTLKSFKAFGVGRGVVFGLPDGNLHAIEYRVPQYTHTVNVPITLEGVRSEEDKRYDDIMNNLSVEDRKAWDRLKGAKCLDAGKRSERQLFKQLPADLQKKAKAAKKMGDLTPEEQARVAEAAQKVIEGGIETCLREVGMSEEGRGRVIAGFRTFSARRPD